MNAEIKQKWIEALRSGKYKQGHMFLKNSDGSYCCLGVLCDVAGVEIKRGETGLNSQLRKLFGFPGGDDDAYADFVRVTKPDYCEHDGPSTLAHLNDFGNVNFNQIADIIEEQL